MGATAFVAGMGAKAIGAYNSAQAQKSSYRTNAMLAGEQAGQAITAGQTREESSLLRTAQTYGEQRASMAANGVDLGQGSATDVLATTKFIGDRDAAAIQDNALREAWGYKTQSAIDNSAAAGINPAGAAGLSLLGSASTTAGASAFKSLWSSTKTGG